MSRSWINDTMAENQRPTQVRFKSSGGIVFEDVGSPLNIISVPKNTMIFVNKKASVQKG